ncbi:fibronectin type III domain-containing protein [Paenibacillus chibensis]|uniref:Fibronectin type III domain-containing protein n=1 Tax=Paenibacillus chibensis TaxID=59846 RepID=A0ABU6PTJ0_9BACL|nr:fibronectin type III domain-containing protein [Paenibacillus chibensis]
MSRLWTKMFLYTAIAALFTWPFQGFANASSLVDASVATASKKAATLAKWTFKDKGIRGVYPASDGTYQNSSLLQNVGGTFEYVDENTQDISYQGWESAGGPKYWLATVPTTGYSDIKLSSEQSSSGSGPSEFKVQTSTDLTTWTDVPNGLVKITSGCAKQSCKLVNKSLPSSDDKEILYIRWLVSADKAVNTDENPDGIGGGGSCRIRGVQVTGLPLPGKAPLHPTLDITHTPLNQAEKVSASDPLQIRFNKKVTLIDENAIRLTDANGLQATGLKIKVIQDDTLQIEHDPFPFSMTYSVAVGKSAIRGADGIPLVRAVSWSFTVQDSPTMPKLMNMTFNGDPKTSLSFAWYTDAMTATKLQVVEASRVLGNVFPAASAQEFTGYAEEVSTYMSAVDRSSGNKIRFYSHKATADRMTPGTTYKFRVGDGNEWSPVGSFTTDSQSAQPYHFVVGSDSQASNKAEFEPWADTFAKATHHIGNPKFLINAGDLVDNGDLEEQWQWLLGTVQEQLMNVPFVPVLGGHEVTDWDGDETTPNRNFYNHFNLPRNVVKGTHDGSVYSFEYGNALFMVFNSEFDGKLNQDGSVNWEDSEHEQFWNQVDWMRNTVAKSDAKWKFVTFHKSPYAAGDNSAQWEDERVEFYKQNLIPIFDELGIDMVFEAHDHMYMRSFQMYGDKIIDPKGLQKDADGSVIDPKGTVYLMSNALGNKFYYKNNQYMIGEDGEPEEIIGKDGKPVPYDDYFAAVDEQPEKKMFTDVSLSDQKLTMEAITAAVEDEGKPSFSKEGLGVYDRYGIKRTDVKPNPVEEASVTMQDGKAVVTWKAPLSGKEPVRGYRVYEKDDKISKYWSKYVPAVSGTERYSLTIDHLDPAISYHLVIRAVGTRDNSDKAEVSTKAASLVEPPRAPTEAAGIGTTPYRIELSWEGSNGLPPAGYHIYRDDKLVGTTKDIFYEDNGLQPGMGYVYRIKAFGTNGAESLPAGPFIVKTRPWIDGKRSVEVPPQPGEVGN